MVLPIMFLCLFLDLSPNVALYASSLGRIAACTFPLFSSAWFRLGQRHLVVSVAVERWFHSAWSALLLHTLLSVCEVLSIFQSLAYEFFFLQLSKGSNHILLELIMFVLFFLVDFSTFYFLVIAVRVRACAYKDAYAYMCMHVLPFCKL